ncbi:tyrosine-type recombinase/integrase [Paraburkholderia aromaticivorans]|nr:tyrosine-type recombinase/integrase [Paraburkholderia aromaticivorans]
MFSPDEIKTAKRLRPQQCYRHARLCNYALPAGLRVSEATGLARSDVDLEQRLHTRCAKFGKSRWVPIHRTTAEALHRYVRKRDRDLLAGNTEAFFEFDYGRPAGSGANSEGESVRVVGNK